jgi:ketosteroid isomerase-like protein
MASETDALRDAFMGRVNAWLAADLDAYMDCWADDMVIELPSGLIDDKADYRRLVKGGFRWAEPVSFVVHHLAYTTTTGDVVLADWTIRARRRDDHCVIEWRGLSVCELREGKIAWWREHHLAPPAPMAG